MRSVRAGLLVKDSCMSGGCRECAWTQVGSFGGLVDEVQGLKRDKNVLMMELVRLRQQQQVWTLI